MYIVCIPGSIEDVIANLTRERNLADDVIKNMTRQGCTEKMTLTSLFGNEARNAPWLTPKRVPILL